MNITSAQYLKDNEIQAVNGENIYVSIGDNIAITAVIDGQTLDYIPLDPANRHYAAILEWAKEDGNTIQDAD
jgi:DNA polymerase III sliding clamp (beta) subunit (PCNA family)|tara:strand:+ start:284 stop:499 length:216 start_codon:yes stop_codon:yes gene_type:complete